MRKLDYDVVKESLTNSSEDSAIYIGCDSKLTGPYTVFGLVVIIHIESSKGGMCFAKKFREDRRMEIQERLLKEVDYAISCASELQDFVGERTFEVHLDLNGDKKHKSNKLLTTAVGWVESRGFKFKIKPNAFAASTAADYILQ